MNTDDLRSSRLTKGLNQTEAGRRLGVSQPYLAMLERGQRQGEGQRDVHAQRRTQRAPRVACGGSNSLLELLAAAKRGSQSGQPLADSRCCSRYRST